MKQLLVATLTLASVAAAAQANAVPATNSRLMLSESQMDKVTAGGDLTLPYRPPDICLSIIGCGSPPPPPICVGLGGCPPPPIIPDLNSTLKVSPN
jgi:hypothetical protein